MSRIECEVVYNKLHLFVSCVVLVNFNFQVILAVAQIFVSGTSRLITLLIILKFRFRLAH